MFESQVNDLNTDNNDDNNIQNKNNKNDKANMFLKEFSDIKNLIEDNLIKILETHL